jgi:fructose-bisphosphate aldolase class II
MPVATPQQYREMLAKAHAEKYAYAGINIATIEQANAVMAGFAEAGADGLVQISTGGAEFASGLAVKDMVLGAVSLAQHVHLLAEQYNVLIALHTDHCQADKVDTFLRPLMEYSRKRVEAGQTPLFNSHMFDGSALPLKQNMDIAVQLLEECAALGIVLEVEAGVVGGEEDGVSNEDARRINYIQRLKICLRFMSGWRQWPMRNICLRPLSAMSTVFTNPVMSN